MLKISAVYLEKQKCFFSKKIFSKPRLNKFPLFVDPTFSEGFASNVKKRDSKYLFWLSQRHLPEENNSKYSKFDIWYGYLVKNGIPVKSKSPNSTKPKLAQNKDCDVSHKFANLLHLTQASSEFYKETDNLFLRTAK